MEQILLDKPTVPHVVKKLTTFYGTRVFITVFIKSRHLSLSWARLVPSTSCHSISIRPNWILLSHLRLRLPNGPFAAVFPTITLYAFFYSPHFPLCYKFPFFYSMYCPVSFSWLDSPSEPRPPHLWRFEVYSDTLPSVGLLWTSDRPDAQTSTWQHTKYKRKQTSMLAAGFELAIPESERP
jgi:hypothetical protein